MNITKPQLQKLDPSQLQELLIKVTIGGSSGKVNQTDKALLLAEYTSRAFPDIEVLSAEATNTAASLNSLSGKIKLKKAGKEEVVFGKIHIEGNAGKLNPLGAEKEYVNADLLAAAGWPVLQPSVKSTNPDYPLLLYPIVEAPPLFDKLEESNLSGKSTISQEELNGLAEFNNLIGQKENQSLRIGSSKEAIDSPVQYLFYKRFQKGGRIDQWYKNETLFKLPGLNKEITWAQLLDIKWTINSIKFNSTLREIIEKARNSLGFNGEEKAFLSIYHGDDHAGNIRLTNPPVTFDPAFAGWNPALLDLKILAHNGFLPMAAMYYFPKGLKCIYKKVGNILVVSVNFQNLPLYKIHEQLAKQIIDSRIIPVLKTVKRNSGDIQKERRRIESGLVGCALLTINIAQMLKKSKAIGLLPMAIMLNELKSLPALEYLDQQIKKLEVS